MCIAERSTNAAGAVRSHTCGVRVGICARTLVGLPLFVDKEEPNNSCLFSDDQSIAADW